MADTTTVAPPAADILVGVIQIAEFLFGDGHKYSRRVHHMISLGLIPTFRMGKLICAKKSALVAAIATLETAEVA